MPDVFMPRLSDTMTEGAIAQWLKAEGDEIHRGDVLAEIETDKAVMDLEAYEGGVLEKIVVQPGETVPIGAQIAVIGDGSGGGGGAAESPAGGDETSAAAGDETPAKAGGDESAAEQPAEAGAEQPAEAGAEQPAEAEQPAAPATEPAAAPPPPAGESQRSGPLKASPVVRSLARTHGIDLSSIDGTGPGGRIIRADVEQLLGRPQAPAAEAPSPAGPSQTAPAQPAAPEAGAPQAGVAAPVATPGEDDERVPLSTVRKVTARRLSEAALVPVFQLTTVLDASRLVELRADINARLASAGVKVSVTDLLVRGCAVALRAHPEVNSSFGGDAIIRRGHVNVGIAVALEDGLIVPVVKDADRKSVSEIGAVAKDLATRARAGKLKPDEFSGGTFTVSNLGMYGIDTFIAVLNPPEAAILAVGSTADEPVVIDGEVQVRPRMRLTLTVDHRVLDGATAAAFLRDLTDLLAEPLRILV